MDKEPTQADEQMKSTTTTVTAEPAPQKAQGGMCCC